MSTRSYFSLEFAGVEDAQEYHLFVYGKSLKRSEAIERGKSVVSFLAKQKTEMLKCVRSSITEMNLMKDVLTTVHVSKDIFEEPEVFCKTYRRSLSRNKKRPN